MRIGERRKATGLQLKANRGACPAIHKHWSFALLSYTTMPSYDIFPSSLASFPPPNYGPASSPPQCPSPPPSSPVQPLLACHSPPSSPPSQLPTTDSTIGEDVVMGDQDPDGLAVAVPVPGIVPFESIHKRASSYGHTWYWANDKKDGYVRGDAFICCVYARH